MRKEAYQDGLLIALLELAVTWFRFHLADLANADVRTRLSDFVRLVFGFTVYSLNTPDELKVCLKVNYLNHLLPL